MPELIFVVEVFHWQKLILSRVVETETESGWFWCSPFRDRPKGEACGEHFKRESGDNALALVEWGSTGEVSEVSLQMEDMDGMQLNGRDDLGILQSCHIRFADVELRYPRHHLT
ncbi:F-box protein [Sesbania bispinosa]|nr:F-box protein [Sesbania bispinosa]